MAETRAVYRDRPQEAGEDAAGGARRALQIAGDRPLAAMCLDVLATATAARGQMRAAATILASTEAARAEMGVDPDDDEAAIRAKALRLLGSPHAAQPVDLESALRLATGE